MFGSEVLDGGESQSEETFQGESPEDEGLTSEGEFEYVDEPEREPGSEEADSFTDVNPEELPPELQAIYKHMQSGFTKKTQEIAGIRKTLEKEKSKAETLDRIMSDPNYRRAFLATMGEIDSAQDAGTRSAGPSISINPHPDVDPGEVFDEATHHGIEAASDRLIEQKLLPALQPYENAIKSLLGEVQKSRWETLTTKYPGADKYATEVSGFLQVNPNASLEQALRAVAGGEIFQASKPTKKSGVNRRKKVALTRGEDVPASRTRPAGKGQDILDIVRAEMKNLGMGSGW